MEFKTSCLNCGRLTDIRNQNYCSTICEGEKRDKEKMYRVSSEGLPKTILEGLPTFKDVQSRRIPNPINLKDKQLQQKKAKLRMLEEQKYLSSGKRLTPFVYKKLEKIGATP